MKTFTIFLSRLFPSLTVQSATSSLSGFQLAAFAVPIDVDSCCKMTVSKSERERFISDFGLSFSLDPVKQHDKNRKKNYVRFLHRFLFWSQKTKICETNLQHLTCVQDILHCVKSMRKQFDRNLDPDFYPRINSSAHLVKVSCRNLSIVRICSKCSESKRHMLQ